MNVTATSGTKMRRRPITKKSLAQLHTSIEVDADAALETVRALLEPAPLFAPTLLHAERDLFEILAAVRRAQALQRKVSQIVSSHGLSCLEEEL